MRNHQHMRISSVYHRSPVAIWCLFVALASSEMRRRWLTAALAVLACVRCLHSAPSGLLYSRSAQERKGTCITIIIAIHCAVPDGFGIAMLCLLFYWWHADRARIANCHELRCINVRIAMWVGLLTALQHVLFRSTLLVRTRD